MPVVGTKSVHELQQQKADAFAVLDYCEIVTDSDYIRDDYDRFYRQIVQVG